MNEFELNKSLSKIATWGKFSGIVFIVLGAINALVGLFAFVVGAIPGVITIVLGYFLNKAGKDAAALRANYDENAQISLYKNIGTYLQIQGILVIVAIAFAILGILITIIFSASLFTFLNNGYY